MSENIKKLEEINKLLERGANLSKDQKKAFEKTFQDIQNGNNS